MADSASLLEELNQHQEQLNAQLEGERLAFSSVLGLLERTRATGAAALLLDFDSASEDKVEDNIWNAHLKVNAKLREGLRKLKTGGNARVVERRKAGTDYLKFIKSSQKYYRGLIRSLHASYGGIKALQHVAGELARHDEEVRPRSRRQANAAIEQKVLRSCYRALVQLGDLSRYRESELADKEPNWSHAVGFYDLARCLIPASGVAYNQLAIVALGDGNLFQATYYLYRALSTNEPHPQAEANLRRAFYKISTTKESTESSASSSAMIVWYLRLVSKCYHGKPYPEHAELENEVVSQLKRQINVAGGSTMLRKIYLIVFAGCHFAKGKFTKDPDVEEHLQSYFKFYERLVWIGETLQDAASRDNVDILRPLETILPLVRLMMMWAVANQAVLISSVSVEMDELQTQFWKGLAKCLDLAAVTCELQALSDVDYMLEEDEDSIAFEPLLSIDTRQIWYDESGSLRKRWHNKPRGPDCSSRELLARMRYFLQAGMRFSTDERTPLVYDFSQATIVYHPRDSAQKVVPQILSRAEKPSIQSEQAEKPSSDLASDVLPVHDKVAQARRNSDQDAEAERMVTDLVGPASSIASEPSDPPTRPGSSYHSSSASKTGSSYPAGSTTVNELLNVAKSLSPPATVPVPTSRISSSQPPNNPHRSSSRDATSSGEAQLPAAKVSMIGSPARSGPALLQRTTPQQPTGVKTLMAKLPTLIPRTNSSHSRIQSIGSAASQQPAGVTPPNGTWSSYHPTNSKENENNKLTDPVTPTSRVAPGANIGPSGEWETETALTEYGMGSTLLFGAGNSPWSMTGDETKRLSSTGSPRLGSPRLPPSSPALRHDSGTSSGRNASTGVPAGAPWRSSSRPGS